MVHLPRIHGLFGDGLQGLPGHGLHQGPAREVGDRCGDDPAGVAQDRDGLADLVHLLEVVRDEQEGDAGVLQGPHPREQPLDLPVVELGGGFVEDDEAGAEAQRPGDLHHLAVLDLEIGGAGVGVDVYVPGGEEVRGLGAQPAPADEAPSKRLPVDEEVLRDRQFGDDGGLLVDAGDFAAPRVPVGEGGRGFPVEADLALVGGLESGEDGDQGRLSGAVAADQGVGLAGQDGEPAVGEGGGGAVALDDAPCLYEWRRHPTVLPQSSGSSTLSLVTSGAGSWSSRMPPGSSTMVEPWSVGPGSKVFPSIAALM